MRLFYKLEGKHLILDDENYNEISNLLYDKIIIPSRKIKTSPYNNQNIENKIDNLCYKIKASYFHKNQIKNQIDNLNNIDFFIKNKTAFETYPKKHFLNYPLIFETEAFLIQVRASLDISIQLLKYFYPYLNSKSVEEDREALNSENGNTGEKTIKLILKNGNLQLAEFLSFHIKDWVQDLEKYRNTVTHRSQMKNFYCFVLINNKENYSLQEPIMPSGIKVTEYCFDIFNKLLNYNIDLIEKFLIKN